MQHEVDLLLHPRVPPLVRSLPHVETLSLFPAEEGQEERDARQLLGLSVAQHSLASEASPQSADTSTLTPQGNMVVDGGRACAHSHTAVGLDTVPYSMVSQSKPPVGTIPARTEASIMSERINGNSESVVPSSSVQLKVSTYSSEWLPANATTGTSSSSTQLLAPNPLSSFTHLEKGTASLPATEQELMSVPNSEGNDDEPMPVINMESDSDSD